MSLTKDFTPFDSRNSGLSGGTRRSFPKSWGAEFLHGGEVLFRLWAPDIERLRLKIDGRMREMLPAGQGWFTLTVEAVSAGTPYKFIMPDGTAMADPASRAQAGGMDDPSVIIDPTAYRWITTDWSGHPAAALVAIELDIGALTPEGSFRAATDKIAEPGFRQTLPRGTNALTLVSVFEADEREAEQADAPQADAPQTDGRALLYAPHHRHGGPEAMKAFVDAAHRQGFSLLIDITRRQMAQASQIFRTHVPSFFDARRVMEGEATVDFYRAAVRKFFVENAVYWLEEFNLDGLRLRGFGQENASSDMHMLKELAEHVLLEPAGRPRHVIVEAKPPIG